MYLYKHIYPNVYIYVSVSLTKYPPVCFFYFCVFQLSLYYLLKVNCRSTSQSSYLPTFFSRKNDGKQSWKKNAPTICPSLYRELFVLPNRSLTKPSMKTLNLLMLKGPPGPTQLWLVSVYSPPNGPRRSFTALVKMEPVINRPVSCSKMKLGTGFQCA